jgi:hypothetical protein
MSFKTRLLWVFPAVLVASWLAVRSLAASSPEVVMDDPPLSLGSQARELPDPALGRMIGHFADVARAARR